MVLRAFFLVCDQLVINSLRLDYFPKSSRFVPTTMVIAKGISVAVVRLGALWQSHVV